MICTSILLLFSGACAHVAGKPSASAALSEHPSIVLFPLENLSGGPAPLKAIRESYRAELVKRGIVPIDDETMEGFMAKNRIRYTAGINGATGEALRSEIGANAVLMTSVELYTESAPPKIAIISRLVSSGPHPEILWADGAGMAGDETPGLLDLHLVNDPNVLKGRTVESLAVSLSNYLREPNHAHASGAAKGKFAPKISYQDEDMDKGKARVAVAPFFNRSNRKNGGELMALHFIVSLKRSGRYNVVEPGLVRDLFLNRRIIMDDGISYVDADSLFSGLDIDLVLTGKVTDYQDYEGAYGEPIVAFSTQLMQREDWKVIWSSMSRNEGNDRVFFFDLGKVNTAYLMASQMTRSVTEKMVTNEGVK